MEIFNKLLKDIDSTLNNQLFETEILIVNDCSTMPINVEKSHLKFIKKISVINLKKFRSQKSIAIGLNYLDKKNDNFFITVMDSDGEDNPYEIKMLEFAQNHEDYVVTSNRKKRGVFFNNLLL